MNIPNSKLSWVNVYLVGPLLAQQGLTCGISYYSVKRVTDTQFTSGKRNK